MVRSACSNANLLFPPNLRYNINNEKQFPVMSVTKENLLGGPSTINEKLVQTMADRIVDRFTPQKVIIFGSWARGETVPDSDLDFLVVMPYQGSKRDCQVSIRRELKDFGIPKDIIVLSPDEFQQKGDLNGSIYKTAITEGKVLYVR